ncbi:hypothetical protein HRG_003762 [Hirsutella rhossiliensis]|uniref:CmcJ-like methyltransferase n=1 Tax=Hirsutella rhossiliensis TaxID=111463 RepID=A0A9P8SKB2_9HYPO|nr:uncharacterized protein HRG_03762 [Hirsutella rhossiliensis]KAH0965746.1 hypothetical protein HRG_03762 [Hirsutella rhossiliensis]
METSISYLAQDPIFDIEKPFDTHVTVTVYPVTDPDKWDLEKHGFCFVRARTNLKAEDAFTRKREAQKDYWYEIEAVLHERFPQYSRIECYDCTVRKRDPDFPANIRIYTNVEQPAPRPHSDCTPRGAHLNLKRAFPNQERYWEGKDFDILKYALTARPVNGVWRPLRGPNNDWPLAMCDFTTIDPSADVRVNDAIRRDRVDENAILHFNEKHKWYIMKDQSEDDLIVFRNADSLGKRAQGFHCSVFNPEAGGQLRESVEVRCVAFR